MRHLKMLSLLGIVSFLGACASGFPPGPNTGQASYDYIGCHKAVNSPAADGSVAFAPFGLDPVATGNFVFFKQYNADGTVSPVNAKPC